MKINSRPYAFYRFATTCAITIGLIAFIATAALGQTNTFPSSGNVGIGTTGPNFKLQVTADSTAGQLAVTGSSNTNKQLRLGFNTTSDYGLIEAVIDGTAFKNLALQPNGGNVGIGTTSPGVDPLSFSLNLTLAGSGINRPVFQFVSNIPDGVGAEAGFLDFIYNTNSAGHKRIGMISYETEGATANQRGGVMRLFTKANAGTLLERMRIDSSGNVGIGISAPNYRLDVQGGAINASGGLCIAGDCKTAWSQVGGGGSSQWTTSGTSVHYNTGNVGIGTTSPADKLHVAGGTRVDGTNGRVYLGTTAPTNARGLEIIEENATTFSLRHHDPLVAWQNIVINPHGGNVGIGTLSPTTKLHVAGDGKVTGNLTVDGNIAAKYQDVAEWVPAVQALPTGTVVTLNRTQSNLVEASSKAYDTGVAGVISTQPGITLGERSENKVLVATTGRVKVKVDATNTPIRIGDLLVTSEQEGVAMKSVPVDIGGVKIHRPGTIIGKALEPLAKGTGEILVLLSLQ